LRGPFALGAQTLFGRLFLFFGLALFVAAFLSIDSLLALHGWNGAISVVFFLAEDVVGGFTLKAAVAAAAASASGLRFFLRVFFIVADCMEVLDVFVR